MNVGVPRRGFWGVSNRVLLLNSQFTKSCVLFMSPLCFIHIVLTFKMGRGSSEVTEHLPGMGKVLSLIPRTTFKC